MIILFCYKRSFRDNRGREFYKMTMLPTLKKFQSRIKIHCQCWGYYWNCFGKKKYNFSFSTTDYKEILSDPEVDLVLITTRHDRHAELVVKCLENNKNVFVEKPLALNASQLCTIIDAYNTSNGKTLTVGFNRRFSPHSNKAKSLIGNSQINVIATMNAGAIPANVWIHDMNVGGGRIIGEACHFIDLITYLTDSKVVAVCMNAMGVNVKENTDTATILLKYENGSTGTINYFANGSKEYPKERIEIYSQGEDFSN